MTSLKSSWRDFWDSDETTIYVNARHRTLHDQRVASDAARIVGRAGTVLDYGSGEATQAGIVARTCDTLLLSDAAPTVRARVTARYAAEPAIRVLSPEEVAALPAESLDVVVMNSLAQYLKLEELRALLRQFHAALRPGGRLVLGDVLQPDQSAVGDALALLKFGWEGGFLVAATAGLVRTALSDYRKLRSELGLSAYEESHVLALLEEAGFEARRHEPNIGHNPARMTFVGVKPPEADDAPDLDS
jgi:SAM-dependent methyltransferase